MIHIFKYIFKFIVKIITGYYLINWIFWIILSYSKNPHKKTIYLKDLPFIFNHKSVYKLRLISQFIFTIFSTSIIAFALFYNFAPLGITVSYSTDSQSEYISKLGPEDRIRKIKINAENVYHQNNDLVYFSTKMLYDFDTAKVKLTFQNNNPDQTISIGFQDQPSWHYETQFFDVPFLNTLTWNHIGEEPYLYQNKPRYSTVADFLHNLPKDAIIGTYDTTMDIGRIGGTQLKDYKPSPNGIVINTPLRGKHILYVYLKDEPFQMSIRKQDLNWYEDPDPVTVKIYKGNDLVYQASASDDGITENSGQLLPEQELKIKNPGKVFPESGVYKVVIDANSDTVIKQISTNLHKVVFEGSIFPVANKRQYGNIVSSTSATIVYTNALVLGASTYHMAGIQTIKVGDQDLKLNTLKDYKTIIPRADFTEVILPKNDLIFNGYMGYFSFSPDSFFLPTSYRIIPLSSSEDIDLVDYILTNYKSSKKSGNWQIAEREFDLRSAYINNGRLNWIIKAPNLKDSNRKVKIKSIDITFHKKSIL